MRNERTDIMNTEKFKKSAAVIDRILKIIRGFVIAGIIVSAVFIPLTAILGEKVVADSSSAEFGYLTVKLAGDFHDYLNPNGIKGSIIITLVTSIIVLIAVLLCLNKLREILVPMKEGRPFETGISAKIRQLALMVLIGGAIAEVGRAVGSVFEMKAMDLSLLFNPSAVSGISFHYSISFWFIAGALLLFFLSFVFRYGEELQRESDETL